MKFIIILLFSFLLSINCQLSIIGPTDLISQYGNKPIDIVFRKTADTSNFYVHGEVFFENKTQGNTACEDIDLLPSNSAQNQFSENFKILLANIGSCPITRKARNAQSAGASMLILINENDQDINKVILEEDDTQNDIRIPIGLISHTNGVIMKNYILSNPKNNVMVEVNFQEKTPKKKIEFKLFFSSSELRAYEMINNLTNYLDQFDNQVKFIPIYVTHQLPTYDPNNAKRELNCVTKGKYCYFPKETTIIQDGQRILMESLRQKCMYFKSMKVKNIKYYYQYMDYFYKNCLLSPTARFNDRCSKQNLDIMGYSIDYLDECVADSFRVKTLLSSSYIDNENDIFRDDYAEILKYKLTSFPAAVIDDKPIEGIIKEYKIAQALCDAVKIKPGFCPYLEGTTIQDNPRRSWTYFLIIVFICINVALFIIFRKYIIKRIAEKINFNMIEIDGRVNNILTNFFQFRKQDNDYQSFGKDGYNNNTTSNKISTIEGTVNTV